MWQVGRPVAQYALVKQKADSDNQTVPPTDVHVVMLVLDVLHLQARLVLCWQVSS